MNRYCKDEFINTSKDTFTVLKGEVTRGSKSIRLSANSACSFKYEYKYGDFIAKSMKMVYTISTKNDLITRYKNNVQFQFVIEYYSNIEESDETNFVSVSCMPYLKDEIDGKDIIQEEIDIEQWYVKSITLNIIFAGEENELYINELKVYKLATAKEELIDDDYYNGLIVPLINSIQEMKDKPDGALCRCVWIEGKDY